MGVATLVLLLALILFPSNPKPTNSKPWKSNSIPTKTPIAQKLDAGHIAIIIAPSPRDNNPSQKVHPQ
ncbi:hypothetical protein D3C72_2504280 [compost metagenome]